MTQKTFHFTFFDSCKSTKARPIQTNSFEDFATVNLLHHAIIDNKNAAQCFSLALFAQGHTRKGENVKGHSGIVIDIDNDFDGQTKFNTHFERLKDVEFAAYTTHSHLMNNDKHKVRLVFPTDRIMNQDEYLKAYQGVYKLLNEDKNIDRTGAEKERLFFKPTAPDTRSKLIDSHYQQGEMLKVDDLIKKSNGVSFQRKEPRSENVININDHETKKDNYSGRNDKYKAIVGACNVRGESPEMIAAELLKEDAKTSNPLFSDLNEGMTGTPEVNALLFVANVLKSVDRNRHYDGSAPIVPFLRPENVEQQTKILKAQDRADKRHVKHWDVSRFMAPAPEMKYLVNGVFPYAKPCLFAAAGGAGKSYEMLKAGLYIAAGKQVPPNRVLGCEIHEFGTIVMYTAEDDLDEIHRRLEAIDPDCKLRNQAAGRFKIIPLPDAGGVFSLIRKDGQGGYETNENFNDLLAELKELDNLKAVIFDPMQPFANSDIQSDNSAGQAISSAASQMAAELNATVIFTHHVKKTNEQIITLADARKSIRGVTALVDGVRAVYVLWEVSASEAQKICGILNVEYCEGMVFKGGVAKANGKKDNTTRFYVRDMLTGMLEDRTVEVEQMKPSQKDIDDLIINEINSKSVTDRPLWAGGINGFFERRLELHKDLRDMKKHQFAEIIGRLLNTKVIDKTDGERSALTVIKGRS